MPKTRQATRLEDEAVAAEILEKEQPALEVNNPPKVVSPINNHGAGDTNGTKVPNEENLNDLLLDKTAITPVTPPPRKTFVRKLLTSPESGAVPLKVAPVKNVTEITPALPTPVTPENHSGTKGIGGNGRVFPVALLPKKVTNMGDVEMVDSPPLKEADVSKTPKEAFSFPVALMPKKVSNVEDVVMDNSHTAKKADVTKKSREWMDMQAQSYISFLPRDDIGKETTKEGTKQVTDSKSFEDACFLAAEDPTACTKRLIELAKGNLDAMVEFAIILISGPVGQVGSRKFMRVAAIQLLDHVLEKNDGHAIALCVKGEMLLPRHLFGTGHPETPYPVLEMAYAYFCKADLLGSREGRFLRGRWLVTMGSTFHSSSKSKEGMRYVQEAAAAGHARAYVFMAQLYEFPGKYGWGAEKSGVTNHRMVVRWYKKAAEMGNANALNDVGSSYASAFGGLPFDFDEAVHYYERAIKAGGLTAFENLGTHYETGMSGKATDRIDYRKAMHYYEQGARLRCSKCAYNIATAYDEGLGDEVERDTNVAEKYFHYCLLLAEDDTDEPMKKRALKDLVSLYITRIKINPVGSEIVSETKKRLLRWLNKRMYSGTMGEVNKTLADAVKNKDDVGCTSLIGDTNGELIFKAAMNVSKEVRERVLEVDDELMRKLKHMFGNHAQEVLRNCSREARVKRRRNSEE